MPALSIMPWLELPSALPPASMSASSSRRSLRSFLCHTKNFAFREDGSGETRPRRRRRRRPRRPFRHAAFDAVVHAVAHAVAALQLWLSSIDGRASLAGRARERPTLKRARAGRGALFGGEHSPALEGDRCGRIRRGRVGPGGSSGAELWGGGAAAERRVREEGERLVDYFASF